MSKRTTITKVRQQRGDVPQPLKWMVKQANKTNLSEGGESIKGNPDMTTFSQYVVKGMPPCCSNSSVFTVITQRLMVEPFE